MNQLRPSGDDGGVHAGPDGPRGERNGIAAEQTRFKM